MNSWQRTGLQSVCCTNHSSELTGNQVSSPCLGPLRGLPCHLDMSSKVDLSLRVVLLYALSTLEKPSQEQLKRAVEATRQSCSASAPRGAARIALSLKISAEAPTAAGFASPLLPAWLLLLLSSSRRCDFSSCSHPDPSRCSTTALRLPPPATGARKGSLPNTLKPR